MIGLNGDTYGIVTVLGQLGSKSNSRRLVTIKGRPAFIKSDDALMWTRGFLQQVPRPATPYEGPVTLVAHCYYKDRRRDLDVALLCDALQAGGVIKNDRQILEIHAFRLMDKKNPRVEFSLKAIDEALY